MEKFIDLLKDGTVYQFALLFALIAFNAFLVFTTGILNDTITGCIIGLAVGIPSTKTNISNSK